MLRLLEPKILPVLSPIVRAVNPIAISHAALAVALARPHPHYRRIIGIKRHPTNRIRPFAIEHRSPSRTVVHRLPNAAGSNPDVVLKFILGIHRQRHDAPGSHRRPDQPELQPGESIRGHAAFLLLFRLFLLLFLLLLFFRVLLGPRAGGSGWRLLAGVLVFVPVFILSKDDQAGEGE